MKTLYKSIPKGNNPNDFKEIQIDIKLSNPNTLDEKLDTFYIMD